MGGASRGDALFATIKVAARRASHTSHIPCGFTWIAKFRYHRENSKINHTQSPLHPVAGSLVENRFPASRPEYQACLNMV